MQTKLLDVESGIRGLLRCFGLKVGPISHGRFEVRIRELVDGHVILETMTDALLVARAALEAEFKRLHRELLALVRADPVCRQLMSVPGVGAIVAITFKSGVDDRKSYSSKRSPLGPPRRRIWMVSPDSSLRLGSSLAPTKLSEPFTADCSQAPTSTDAATHAQ